MGRLTHTHTRRFELECDADSSPFIDWSLVAKSYARLHKQQIWTRWKFVGWTAKRRKKRVVVVVCRSRIGWRWSPLCWWSHYTREVVEHAWSRGSRLVVHRQVCGHEWSFLFYFLLKGQIWFWGWPTCRLLVGHVFPDDGCLIELLGLMFFLLKSLMFLPVLILMTQLEVTLKPRTPTSQKKKKKTEEVVKWTTKIRTGCDIIVQNIQTEKSVRINNRQSLKFPLETHHSH